MLHKLVVDNTNINEDYIIPADSDEFQEFSDTLNNIIKIMQNENLAYLCGCTKERISETGEILSVVNDIDIFLQFPKYNNNLFCQPKIGLIKAKYFKYIGVGHHSIEISSIKNNEDKLALYKNKRISITNHFRWNLQGKQRMLNWYKLWIDDKYKGWKNVENISKMLTVFESNLLEYK